MYYNIFPSIAPLPFVSDFAPLGPEIMLRSARYSAGLVVSSSKNAEIANDLSLIYPPRLKLFDCVAGALNSRR